MLSKTPPQVSNGLRSPISIAVETSEELMLQCITPVHLSVIDDREKSNCMHVKKDKWKKERTKKDAHAYI